MRRMRRRFGKPSIKELVLVAVVVLVIVVGVIVPGGTGETITAIGGALLAFVIIAKFGISNPPQDGHDPYDHLLR